MNASLDYPVAQVPENGSGLAIEVAEGLHWLRMPVPGRLEAVNVWALADRGAWTIVDTGLRSPETLLAWRAAFAGVLAGTPVRQVIATHLHPDHAGLAGWLAQTHDATLAMSRLEYLSLRVLAGYTGAEAPVEAVRFYRAAGWDERALDRYKARFGEFGRNLYPVPHSFRALEDGQRVQIGARSWEVVVGRGHSPEQTMLYCRDDRLLIAGDQVLPEISSNVSVQPLEPEADPLTAWLVSLEAIRGRVADDVLVLPGHGRPFRGLHRRIDELIAGHEGALDRLAAMIERPLRAVDVFPALFKRPIDETVIGLATGESLAHLACLRDRGCAVSDLDAAGVAWWRRLDRPLRSSA